MNDLERGMFLMEVGNMSDSESDYSSDESSSSSGQSEKSKNDEDHVTV